MMGSQSGWRDGAGPDEDLPASERFDRAVREGATLVENGDRPVVAADYVAEQHGLDDPGQFERLRVAIDREVTTNAD